MTESRVASMKSRAKKRIRIQTDVDATVSDTSRKNNYLSLKDKAEILQRLDQGAQASNLAREYGISKSTISRFKKKKIVIEKAVTTIYPNNTERRTMRGTFYKKTESALYQWYLEQRRQNITVTGMMLRKRAQQLYDECEVSNYSFCTSIGWLSKFKRRYGIRLTKGSTTACAQPDSTNVGVQTAEEVNPPNTNCPQDTAQKPLQTVDRREAIRCIDRLIRWSTENTVDSLYLTMLRSLKNHINLRSNDVKTIKS